MHDFARRIEHEANNTAPPGFCPASLPGGKECCHPGKVPAGRGYILRLCPGPGGDQGAGGRLEKAADRPGLRYPIR